MLSPERQTLLTVVAGTDIGMPAFAAAWRAVIWPWPGQEDLAHEDVVDLVGRDAGPLEGGGDGEATELACAERGEAAGELADGRPGPCDDDRSGHG